MINEPEQVGFVRSQTLLGETISEPECLEKGGASSTFVWRARNLRRPVALAGAVSPLLLFPVGRQTALEKLCGGPPLRRKFATI